MIWLVKLPNPLLSTVWLSFKVGLGEVLQHTPRAVTEDKPSKLTLPPQVTDVKEILLTPLVVIAGVATSVVN